MTDPRAEKTFEMTWKEWIEFCTEQEVDPIENCEHGFDLGGGASFTVACYDVPDEVAHLIDIQHKLDVFHLRRWKPEGGRYV